MMKRLFPFVIIFFLTLSAALDGIAHAETLVHVGFGKYIDYQDWSQKMNMGFETLLKSLQNKIRIYRFNLKYMDPENKSSVFQAVPFLTENLLKTYGSALTMARSRAMYVDESEQDNPTGSPIVLLRNDSEHWTVIHEYTHHLFHQARKQRNSSLPKDFRKQFTENNMNLSAEIETFKNNGNSFSSITDLDRVVELVQKTTRLLVAVQINFPIEEVIIENMIRNFYAQNPEKLPNMSLRLYGNSISYVDSKLDQVHSNLDYLIAATNLFIKGTQPGSISERKLNLNLTQILKIQDQIKNFKIIKLKTSEDI